MRIRYACLAALLFTLAPEAAAQEPDTLDAYRDLNEEIRDLPLSGRVYFSQLEEAWDRAVVAGRYERADSVAVLAELYTVETTGAARRTVVWPSAADRLALAFLRGDTSAFEWLIEDGRWWEMQSPVPTYYGEFVIAMSRPMIGGHWYPRASTLAAWSRDIEAPLRALEEAGADASEVALAALAFEKMRIQPYWMYPGLGVPAEQKAVNAMADAFLGQFPGSRYEPIVRRQIREVYDAKGSIALYLGLGAGGGGGDLGEATGVSVAGEIGIGLRYGLGHANIGFHGTDLAIKRDIDGTGRDYLAEGDRLTVGLLGVDVGPRIALGGLDIMPYVSGGLLLQNVSAPGEDVPQRSTYEPPAKLGWGYGFALEYAPGRATRFGGFVARARVGQIEPRLTRGFEDSLSGTANYASIGFSMSGFLRNRQM